MHVNAFYFHILYITYTYYEYSKTLRPVNSMFSVTSKSILKYFYKNEQECESIKTNEL